MSYKFYYSPIGTKDGVRLITIDKQMLELLQKWRAGEDVFAKCSESDQREFHLMMTAIEHHVTLIARERKIAELEKELSTLKRKVRDDDGEFEAVKRENTFLRDKLNEVEEKYAEMQRSGFCSFFEPLPEMPDLFLK